MRGRQVGVLGVAVTLLLLAPQAFAANPPQPPPPAELIPKVRPTTRSFYGWQILATGEVGGIMTAASVMLPDKPFGSLPATVGFVTGVPLFALAGPTIHWSHGDFTKGLISFGGNLAFPIIGGFVGRSISCNAADAPDDCESRGFLTGLSVATMITPVVDALVLGWEDVPVEDALVPGAHRLGRTSPPKLAIAPWSNVGKNGLFQVGLSGQF